MCTKCKSRRASHSNNEGSLKTYTSPDLNTLFKQRDALNILKDTGYKPLLYAVDTLLQNISNDIQILANAS